MLGLLKFLLNLEPCKTMTVTNTKKIDYKKTSQLSKHEYEFYIFKARILPMEVLGSPHCDAFRFLADLFGINKAVAYHSESIKCLPDLQ